ncbi:hypothetical protein B0O99DRAFT_530541 [Bisporella sp. PMI_857]|nr:hypothetical protein B0O99DRAFT_530541 [Bisporella sp. PMI_857]
MLRSILVAGLVLISQTTASAASDATFLIRRDDSAEHNMRRYVESVVEPVERDAVSSLVRRQTTLDSGISVAEWDTQTMLACTAALEALNGKASNDAGMAVCYNLPLLDNSTGVFKADLRLFKISEPTGQFKDIPTQDVTVGLTYIGATVQAVNSSEIGRRDERERRDEDVVSLISWPRRNVEKRQSTTVPTITQAYAFVGQINKDLIGVNMNTSELEKLLAPTVTLTGLSAAGLQVNATLDSTEASFVSGVFAKEATVAKTVVEPPMQTLVVADNAPFVVPGMNILIFPIGGVITGIWTILLCGTIGYGTFGRMQFREQYRRRNARATKGGMVTI